MNRYHYKQYCGRGSHKTWAVYCGDLLLAVVCYRKGAEALCAELNALANNGGVIPITKGAI